MNLDSLTSLTIGGDYSIQISDTVSRGLERIDLLDADFLNELDNYEEIESYHTIMYERIWWAEQSAQNHIELPEEYIELGIGYGDIASILYGHGSEIPRSNKSIITNYKAKKELPCGSPLCVEVFGEKEYE